MFIVKVPGIDSSGKTKGCEKAGNSILDYLKETYANESLKKINFDGLELEEIHLDNKNFEYSSDLIYKNSFEVFEEKPKIIFLGGDHSISYSIIRAFFDECENSEREPCLIIFDAHPDCMNLDEKLVHRSWLRKLTEENFPLKNILLVGIRSIHKEESDFLENKNIRIISMNQLLENLEETCEIIMEFAEGKELYISVDIDVIDPVFAPATAYCEPGGLSSREFIYIIQRVNKMKNLRAIDITEINPDRDKDNLTVKLGAKIVGELI